MAVLFFAAGAAVFGATAYERCRCNQTSPGLGPGEGSICCGDSETNAYKTSYPGNCCNITGKSWVNGECKTKCTTITCPSGQTQNGQSYLEDTGTCCKTSGTAQWTWTVTNSNLYSGTDSNAVGEYASTTFKGQAYTPCNNTNNGAAPLSSECTAASGAISCYVYVVTMAYSSQQITGSWSPGTSGNTGASENDMTYKACCKLFLDWENYYGTSAAATNNCKTFVPLETSPGNHSCTCGHETLNCDVTYTYKVEQRKYVCKSS